MIESITNIPDKSKIYKHGRSSNSNLNSKIHSYLNNQFSQILEKLSYFLGIEAARDDKGLYLTQAKYIIDLLKKTMTIDANESPTPIVASLKLSKTDNEPFVDGILYKRTIGASQY